MSWIMERVGKKSSDLARQWLRDLSVSPAISPSIY